MTGLREWLRAMPKAELHVHLEGTMAPDLYQRIAKRNGLPAGDDAGYAFSDFPSFLRAFLTAVKVLQKPEDFADLTRAYLQKSAADGVKHVEFMLSPATQRTFAPKIDVSEMVVAVSDEIERAKLETGISAVMIFDIVRNLGVEAGLRDVELARRNKDRGVVGVGLGGDERSFPARDFQEVFIAAANAGLRRTAHAGEASGPESVVDAVRLLGAERIGHGVAAAARPDVLRLLADDDVAIDACPTSNAVTGAVKSGESHPLKVFMEAGVTVSLSSDDPAFFGVSLLDEYMYAAQRLGLERSELATLAANGFHASFAPDEKKVAWEDELKRYLSGSTG